MPSLLATARGSIWLGWLIDNPLLIREVRRRMRGRLFTWSLIAYLAALGGVSCIIMFTTYPFATSLQSAREMIQAVGRIGSTLFKGMCFVEGVIALFLAPMLTAGLATAEKEKDTFDFLRVTTLKSRTFVWGCLLTTACFLLLVFTCTLPILGLTFIFGGVSMQEIMTFNLGLFLLALAIASWGIFNSTNYKRSRSVQGSIILFFVIVMFVVLPRLRFGSGIPGLFGTSSLATYAVPMLALICLMVMFSVAAARRLYEPNNRMFNYKQFLISSVILLGGISGWLIYRVSYTAVKPFGQDEIRASLLMLLLVGWILNVMAILFFSTGRVEMGDEVWKIRLRFPFFRFLNERIFVYGFLLLLWLGPVFILAWTWDTTGNLIPLFVKLLPIALLSLAVVLGASLCFSAFSDNRNHVMIAVSLVLVVLWGVLPAFGYFLGQISASGRGVVPTGFRVASESILALSPIHRISQIVGTTPLNNWLAPLVFMGLLFVLSLLPFLSRPLRRRFAVSYDWTDPSRESHVSPEISQPA